MICTQVKVKVTQSCLTLCDHSQIQNTGMGSLPLLQGIFPTQRSNPGVPHFRWILYQLSRKGSTRILGWIAYPFSRGSFQPRNWTGVSCIAGRFFSQLSYQGSPCKKGRLIEMKRLKTLPLILAEIWANCHFRLLLIGLKLVVTNMRLIDSIYKKLKCTHSLTYLWVILQIHHTCT